MTIELHFAGADAQHRIHQFSDGKRPKPASIEIS